MTTRIILDETQATNGFYADLTYPEPSFLKMSLCRSKPGPRRQRPCGIGRKRPGGSICIVGSSSSIIPSAAWPSSPRIPKMREILERIRAKRNQHLTYQGQKVAGWIFPKCRQAELAAVVRI